MERKDDYMPNLHGYRALEKTKVSHHILDIDNIDERQMKKFYLNMISKEALLSSLADTEYTYVMEHDTTYET